MVWPIETYGTETWTVKKTHKKRITAFEMTAFRRMKSISWKERRTNAAIMEELGERSIYTRVFQHRKLKYSGHVPVVRANNLYTTVLHGRITNREAGPVGDG